MDDTDLRGLDLASAKEYIFAFAVDLKRLDREVEAARVELETWKGRVGLAESKGLAELAIAARAKAEDASGRLASLEAERSEARGKISRMREQLPMIRARERSIDPDRLLAELQLMTGELLGPSESAFADSSADGAAAADSGAAAQNAAPGIAAPQGSESGAAPGSGAPSASQRPPISVDREFSKLEASLSADAALAALKKSMGLASETDAKPAEPKEPGEATKDGGQADGAP
jgi:phage shock protein A